MTPPRMSMSLARVIDLACLLSDAQVQADLDALPSEGTCPCVGQPVPTPSGWPPCVGVLRRWPSGAVACDCGEHVTSAAPGVPQTQ